MTVADLIAKLQQLPADLPVYLGDWNEQYAPDQPMEANDGPQVMAPSKTKHGLELPERVVIG
jgi:hypothetical protein